MSAVNVQCEDCECWGYVGLYEETPTGYKCKNCNEKTSKCKMVLEIRPQC